MIYASDAVMDRVDAIRSKPDAERTDEERWLLHYAEANGFARKPNVPGPEPERHGKGRRE